jgi:hypothetical protein
LEIVGFYCECAYDLLKAESYSKIERAQKFNQLKYAANHFEEKV